MQSPDEIYGELFIALHASNHWQDGKTIGDAIPKATPEVILAAYNTQKNQTNFDLIAFANQYFDFPVVQDTDFKSDLSKSPQAHIETLWEVLKRPADVKIEGDSKIALPHPYIVPGGRFNEIYYWDSYFTMLGLQVSGHTDVIKSMVDNFSYLIDILGFIPNGNRTYFKGRSQPPFYAMMVRVLAEQLGEQIYVEYLPYLEKEYHFWMEGECVINAENPTIKRLVRLSENEVLNRYWDEYDTPRPEMYGTDVEEAQHTNREPSQLYRDLRSACESGWDFSSRWLRDAQDLATIHATEIIPVDLNCLLYNLEETIALGYQLSGNTERYEYYTIQALKRKNAILKYCWNSTTNFFHDYDFVKQEHKSVLSLAGLFPLFFKIATPLQAGECAIAIQRDFLKAGGVISTTNTTAQQWDAPNGWAPLQWITIQGLRNYKHHELANAIKENWVNLNVKIYKKTGKMLEKYNVVNIDLETGGGEYPVQDGFGWTNGVLLRLLSEE